MGCHQQQGNASHCDLVQTLVRELARDLGQLFKIYHSLQTWWFEMLVDFACNSLLLPDASKGNSKAINS
eukprot:3429796-Amphidinium_carterae.1